MAQTQKLVTNQFAVHNAKQFVGTFSGTANNNYYVFAARHIPYDAGDSTIPTLSNSILDTDIDVYNNMIFAKRVLAADVKHMIPRYDWTSGTIYSEYTHLEDDFLSEQYFVVVDELTEYNVYKCLFNNSNTASSVAPSRVGSAADLDTIITGDGYYWKYMYTISKTNFEKFASIDYVPLTPNTSVIENATPGSVEVVKIGYAGSGYDNYIASAQFASGDINYGTSTVTYRLPSDSSSSDDYWKGCVMRITSGDASEQYRKIIESSGTGNDKLVTLDSPFSTTPAEGDFYEVYPYVHVWGDGAETVVADGIAIIDPDASNGVSSVEMLSIGAGYRTGFVELGSFPSTSTNTSIALSSVITGDLSFTEADLIPIISPPGGHGSDPYTELNGHYVCISTRFSNSESGTIPTQNDFRQVGLIKDPQFHNVDLVFQVSNTVGTFTVGETVAQYKQIVLNGNVSVVSGNSSIIKANQGVLSDTVNIINAGTRYDNLSNNSLVFDNTGTGGSGAEAIFSINNTFISSVSFRANNAVGVSVANFIGIGSNVLVDGQRVRYYVDAPGSVITGLSNNENYFVVSSNSTGLKLSSTLNGSEITVSNSTSTGNSNLSVVNGAITSVTVTNAGSGYTIAPTATINPTAASGASNAQITFSLANPEITIFGDSFEEGDYCLVTKTGQDNFLSIVSSVDNDYLINVEDAAPYSASDCKVSLLKLTARGVVTATSLGQVTVDEVTGIFDNNAKVIGLTSGATAITKVSGGVQLNDRNITNQFLTTVQLSRLVGDIGASQDSFNEDEYVEQDSPIALSQPTGALHHVEINSGINDDVMYISNEYGNFVATESLFRDVIGRDTDSVMTNLVAKYQGDFVKGSGRVLYYENVQPVTRSGNKSEIIRIILEF